MDNKKEINLKISEIVLIKLVPSYDWSYDYHDIIKIKNFLNYIQFIDC